MPPALLTRELGFQLGDFGFERIGLFARFLRHRLDRVEFFAADKVHAAHRFAHAFARAFARILAM